MSGGVDPGPGDGEGMLMFSRTRDHLARRGMELGVGSELQAETGTAAQVCSGVASESRRKMRSGSETGSVAHGLTGTRQSKGPRRSDGPVQYCTILNAQATKIPSLLCST